MTVFNTGPQAVTANFHPGDTELVYMEVFRAERFAEVALSDWLAHTPINMVTETLNLDPSGHRPGTRSPRPKCTHTVR